MTSSDTASRFFRSAGAATFSQIWRVGVTFVTALILRRLVAPADWGLWDWSQTVFLVLGAVRDLGLVYHVVRVKPRPYGNLLAVELGWGALLVGLTFTGSPLLALGFSEPDPNVVPVLRALGLFLLFDGLATVPRSYFENELRVGRAVAPEILRNAVFAVTSITLAWLGYGVWSMVVAHVASSAVYAGHLWLRAWRSIPLHWERGRTLALLGESLPLALIWFLIILTRYIDPLILAARFSAEVVGEYGFAYFTAFLVSTILVPAVARALYPALVAFSAEPGNLFQAYRLGTLFVLAAEAPVAFFLFVNPDLVLRILGGDAWVEAPSFLRILCFAPLIDPLSRLGGELLKTRHKDRLWIASTGLTLVSYLVGGIILTGLIGPRGMAWANYLPLGGILMTWGIYRLVPDSFAQLVRDIGLIYAAPVAPFLLVVATTEAGGWPRFGASLAAAALVLGFYARRFGPSFLAFFRSPSRTVATEDRG